MRLQESLVTSVHDVQMVLDYLDTRGDLDMSRVGMFGQGSGGTIAILTASVDPRIKAIDLMDPWADWPDWLAKSPQIPEEERRIYLDPAFLSRIAWLDPLRSLTQLKGRPLRLQENLFNVAMPEEVRNRLESALPANTSVVEYHSLEEYTDKVSANGKMLNWLQAQLHSSAEKTSTVQDAEPGRSSISDRSSGLPICHQNR